MRLLLAPLVLGLATGCTGGRLIVHDQPRVPEQFESFELRCRRFEFCPEFTGRVRRAGFRIHEVPIHYDPRGIVDGKKIKASDGFVAMAWLFKVRFERRARVGSG